METKWAFDVILKQICIIRISIMFVLLIFCYLASLNTLWVICKFSLLWWALLKNLSSILVNSCHDPLVSSYCLHVLVLVHVRHDLCVCMPAKESRFIWKPPHRNWPLCSCEAPLWCSSFWTKKCNCIILPQSLHRLTSWSYYAWEALLVVFLLVVIRSTTPQLQFSC